MRWEELLVVPVVVGGAWWVTGRAGQGWWAIFVAGLLVVMGVVVGRRVSGAGAWLWWLTDARLNPLWMAAAVPLMLGVLVRRLEAARQRRVVAGVMGVMVVYYCVLPGVMPVVARGVVLGRATVVDGDGVFRQTHDFTCGPASMVTCLRAVGVMAEEGEVAVVTRCGPSVGTDPGVMADGVSARYGVRARYVELKRASELRAPAVIEVGSGMGWGHYVAVLAVEGGRVCVGDPELGKFWVGAGAVEGEWTGRVVEVQAALRQCH
jgi:hypothetical protein